jgi:single-stranded DNA-binding protein
VRVWEDKEGRKRKDVGVTARDLKLVGKSANGDAERRADKHEGDTDADAGRDEKKDDEDVDLPF